LAAHLFHEVTHFCDMARSALLAPSLKALRSLLDVLEERWVRPLLPPIRNGPPDALPHAEEFTAGPEEQDVMQQSIVQQSASLFPITEHHHEVGATLGTRCSEFHGIGPGVCEIRLHEPIARLAQSGFTPLFKNLQM